MLGREAIVNDCDAIRWSGGARVSDEPKKPDLSIKAVLRGTFARLFGSYGWLLLLAALVALTDLPGYVLSSLFPSDAEAATSRLAWAAYDLLYSFAVFLPFSAFAFAVAALLFERRRQGSGAPAGLKETIGSARAVLFPVMGAMLPLVAVAAAASFAGRLFLFVVGGSLNPATTEWSFVILPWLFVVLDVCLTLLFCVAPLCASLENTGWRAALRRSPLLTKGHRLAVFGLTLLVAYFPEFVLNSLILFFSLYDSTFLLEGSTALSVITTVVEKAVLLPLWWAFTYALYVELRKLEGGADPQAAA
jgi:hypothetical protein